MRSFDKVPWHWSMVLASLFDEGNGLYAHDHSRCDHSMLLHGVPVWNQIAPSDITVLDFDPTNPDWLDCSAVDTNIAMNFVAHSFSLAVWINIDDLSANRMLM